MSDYPKWSKAKKQLKSFICEPLRLRVDFHVINYRKAHDQLGRAVITVDKVEKLSMCTLTAEREEDKRGWEIRNHYDDETNNRDIQSLVHQQLKDEGIYAQYDFFPALDEYFNSSIKESLQSPDILIKILCLLDRRTGKRTLRNMRDIILEEHDIVRYFYELRCETENIHVVF